METIEMIQKLIEILGNVDLATAKTWLETEDNARRLRMEGHEGETDETA
ncbi:MAG TPA: hypothetical protein VIL74_09145 [Pyrinomonadaceae bacterium]|jgi:hypothetical protein